MIRLDTHVVVWLATGERERLSPTVVELIDAAAEVGVSPMVELELTFLHEIGRLTLPGPAILDDLRDRIGLVRSRTSFADAVAAANEVAWTRDPFDRLIVADAVAAGARLVTKDETILDRVELAVW